MYYIMVRGKVNDSKKFGVAQCLQILRQICLQYVLTKILVDYNS